MADFSIWHWIVLVVFVLWVTSVIPARKIAEKAGFHRSLALLYLVPLLSYAVLWYFAFSDWRRTDHRDTFQ